MLHEIIYFVHIIGMTAIVSIASYLLLKKEISENGRKKLSLYLMSAAHTQLLTGFTLFFLLLSEINHMKVGIKMLLAIVVAVVATLYRKKAAANETPNPAYIFIIISSAIVTTLIAFFL